MGESTLVAEHAADIVSMLVAALLALFAVLGVLGSVIAWFVRNGFNDVKMEIKGIKDEVSEDRKAMLEIIRNHENRLTKMETSCEIHHGRRFDD